MRKSKFLLNLIAATAIGLSVFGCDSADSGAIGDTTDVVAANDSTAQLQALREYLVVGERGFVVSPISLNLGPNQSTPSAAPGEVIAGGSGDADGNRALLFEIFGINNVPVPNFNLTAPGGEQGGPNSPDVGDDFGNSGSAGYHGVYVDPTNKYVIGVARSLNRGTAFETSSDVTGAQVQIFSLQAEVPFDEEFPPNIIFGGVLDPTPIQVFPPDQGLFVSGAWSNDARNFYIGIESAVRSYAIDGNSAQLTGLQVVPFQPGGAAVNNPVKLLIPPNDAFVYALDNANNQITRYAREADGTLTLLGQTTTVADPRGATIDRTGTYMYVIGRSSALLAGYRIEASGDLTPIEVFAGLGPIAAPLGVPLGDIDASPTNNRAFLGTYAGVLGAYDIDAATGLLSPVGQPGNLLGGARNLANVEVDPTGQFVVTAQEHDFTELQSFVTTANGFAVPEDPIFANLTDPNDDASNAYSLTGPQADANGNTVFALPQNSSGAFAGDVQGWRISADGSVRAIDSESAVNPYGLDFYQLIVTPPTPNNDELGDVSGTGPDAAPDDPNANP